jgi:thioredoxin-like negative regulator of GroEL
VAIRRAFAPWLPGSYLATSIEVSVLKIFSLRRPGSWAKSCLGLMILSVGSLAFCAGPGWYNNFEQAVQAARQQGRPIFVDFSTSWCSVCKQMDRTTLADPAVVSRLDNFIKVKVDGDAFPQLCQAYGVEAYPTFVHLDPQGRVLEKRVGGMRVQEMAGALDNTLRSVSTSMAIAQANRQAESQKTPAAAQASAGTGRPEIASADLAISSAQSATGNTRNVTREMGDRPAGAAGAENSLYNMTNNPMQGSAVYAAEPASAGRRSRFGSNPTTEGGLKQLAEATALPRDETSAPTGESPAAASDTAVATSEVVAKTKDDAKAAKPSEEKAPEVASKTKKTEPTATAPQQAGKPSPVIESRLAGLPTESLPRPLLNRSASGTTQNLAAPAPSSGAVKAVSVANETIPPLKAQRNDNGEISQSVSKQPVEIASAAPKNSRVSDQPVKTSTDAGASDEKTSTRAGAGDGDKTASAEDGDTGEKSSAGATRSDITRWMKDADTKLVEAHKANSPQRKREARAMYNKVVEKDPENKFGKSDMAYVKMVSLIVDRDSDLLRRQAYTKIKEFETRFPKSEHKDYYTLIRAMLATDLGDTNEAHKLLSDYSDKFPDSKYGEMAAETLKALPPVKKDSAKGKASASSSKGKSSKASSSSKTHSRNS